MTFVCFCMLGKLCEKYLYHSKFDSAFLIYLSYVKLFDNLYRFGIETRLVFKICHLIGLE